MGRASKADGTNECSIVGKSPRKSGVFSAPVEAVKPLLLGK
jgi:hypothetical protein